jgi:hypothetical protein
VVEAGTGGSDKCLGTGPNTICVGLSGSVTAIEQGRRRRVVTGLVSWATPAAERAQGAAAVLVRRGAFYVLLGDALANKRGGNAFGRDGATAGHLIATPPGKAAPRVVANFAAFEAAHNPDGGCRARPQVGEPANR